MTFVDFLISAAPSLGTAVAIGAVTVWGGQKVFRAELTALRQFIEDGFKRSQEDIKVVKDGINDLDERVRNIEIRNAFRDGAESQNQEQK